MNSVQNGTVTIFSRLFGDANDDGAVDLKDTVSIVRYLAGGWNVTIHESSADVHGDDDVNLKDAVLIVQLSDAERTANLPAEWRACDSARAYRTGV